MTVRTIDVREPVMARNDEYAAQVRRRLVDAGVRTFNLISSPGAGKTALLERTLADLGSEFRIAVVTGDVQTQNDADRLSRHTDRLVQAVVTHGACHLDARQVLTALDAIDLPATDILFIENVGNLVCPASWDLGEDATVVLFSVTEGEDKPAKYPKAFRRARYAVLSKLDLLPHVPFALEAAAEDARRIQPAIDVLAVCALSGQGVDRWCEYLIRQRERLLGQRPVHACHE